MRELVLKQITLEDEQGDLRTYEYAILIDEMNVGAFACESYGLQVREMESGTCCIVPHITTSISRMDELCQRVLSGGVTPLTLAAVVEDWL